MSNNDLTKKSLVNTYYDSSVNKLYQVNLDGTKGSEIQMGRTAIPDLLNEVNLPSSTSKAPSDGYVVAYTVAGKGDMFFVNGVNPVGKGFMPVKKDDPFHTDSTMAQALLNFTLFAILINFFEYKFKVYLISVIRRVGNPLLFYFYFCKSSKFQLDIIPLINTNIN